MSNVGRAGLIVVLMMGLAACDRGEKPNEQDGTAEHRTHERARPAKAASSAPTDGTGSASAAEADKPAIRFDMTQDGKQMTADEFDAWMDAQGVSVVKGGAKSQEGSAPAAHAANAPNAAAATARANANAPSE